MIIVVVIIVVVVIAIVLVIAVMFRFFYMSYGVNQCFGIKTSDVLYDTLPLYHSAGGILGVGQAIHTGTTIVIRRKFSASQFWADCVKYNCTVSRTVLVAGWL